MLKDDVKELINDKADDLNKQRDVAGYVSCITQQLNDFINQKINLENSEIEKYLDQLVGCFTTTLHTPFTPGLKILRARAFEKEHRETDVNELSYIAKEKNTDVTLGRLNLAKEPMYYGCIYFNELSGGVNVALAEINAKEGQTVNILRSEVGKELNIYFIGIYDYIFRESRPYFISEEHFSYFKQVYDYQKEKYSKDAFLAHQICDAFFSDVLRKAEHGNLYRVTSLLSKLFLECSTIDGVIYTSVKAEGSPVIALKTESVDSKLLHKEAESLLVQKSHGYALYHALPTGKGKINDNKIEWDTGSKA